VIARTIYDALRKQWLVEKKPISGRIKKRMPVE